MTMIQDITGSQLTFMVGIDHRINFCRELVGAGAEPNASDRNDAARLKNIVFAAIKKSIETGMPKSHMAVWSDSDLGEGVLLRSRAMSLTTAVAADRRSEEGPSEISPTRAWDLATRLDSDLAAVRLNYNPDSPRHVREHSQDTLFRLSRKCRSGNRGLLIELTATPTRRQIDKTGGYEQARTMVLLESMRQLQDAGVEPSVWAFEPPADRRAASALAAQAHLDERYGITVLFTVGSEPHPADDSSYPSKSEQEMTTLAARTLGTTGILVGPAAYFAQLARLQRGLVSEEAAVDNIARRFQSLHRIFSDARATSDIL
jgi:myo-inositol catabolism protein IolC